MWILCTMKNKSKRKKTLYAKNSQWSKKMSYLRNGAFPQISSSKSQFTMKLVFFQRTAFSLDYALLLKCFVFHFQDQTKH